MTTIYKKSYKLKTESVKFKNLDNALSNKSSLQYIQKYRTEDGFLLISNSEKISNIFKRTNELLKYQKIENGFIVDEKEGRDPNTDLYTELVEGGKFLENPLEFLKRYNNIIKIPEKEIPYKDVLILSAKILPTKVILSSDPSFDSVTNFLYEINLVLPYYYKYEKENNSFNIKKSDLVNLNSGFYNIYPKYNRKDYELRKTSDGLKLSNTGFVEIYSLYRASFNGWSTQLYNISQNNQTQISLNLNDYNNLVNITEFKEDYKYIIFKLRENNGSKIYSPIVLISSEGKAPTDYFKRLLTSHPEYLKDYVFIPNKTDISIRYLKNNILTEDHLTLENTDFDKLYTQLQSVTTIPNINITLV